MLSERVFRRALIVIAIAGLLLGLVAWAMDRRDLANWCWAAGTIPVVVGLLLSIVHDFLAGRLGVDAVAFVSRPLPPTSTSRVNTARVNSSSLAVSQRRRLARDRVL
jgi:hypothetical protein